MHQLNSKNFKTVAVRFRGDEDTRFIMPRSTGEKLMHYLASSPAGKHVILTNTDGYQKTVHTSEIIAADPQYETETVDWTKFENYDEIKGAQQSQEPTSTCKGEQSISLAVIHEASKRSATVLKNAEWRAKTRELLWTQRQDWCDSEKGTCFCKPARDV